MTMGKYQDVMLMDKANRVGQMSIDELINFQDETFKALSFDALAENSRKVILAARVQSIGRLDQIKKNQVSRAADQAAAQAAAQAADHERNKAFTGHPREYWKKILNDRAAQLNNNRLSPTDRANLEKQLTEAENVVKSWGKIDAEEQKFTDERQRVLAVDAAHKQLYNLQST